MKFKEFVTKYDYAGSIVLLEGKRDVLDNDKSKLVQLGKLLASETGLLTFRSGNAAGADHYFSEGVCAVGSNRLQVITPYDDHRKKTNQAYDTISLDTIDVASEPQVVYQSKQNKKTETLIDKYVSGSRDRFSIKAAYIIRDTIKVIGAVESDQLPLESSMMISSCLKAEVLVIP